MIAHLRISLVHITVRVSWTGDLKYYFKISVKPLFYIQSSQMKSMLCTFIIDISIQYSSKVSNNFGDVFTIFSDSWRLFDTGGGVRVSMLLAVALLTLTRKHNVLLLYCYRM